MTDRFRLPQSLTTAALNIFARGFGPCARSILWRTRRVGHGFDTDIFLAVPTDCSHEKLPLLLLEKRNRYAITHMEIVVSLLCDSAEKNRGFPKVDTPG